MDSKSWAQAVVTFQLIGSLIFSLFSPLIPTVHADTVDAQSVGSISGYKWNDANGDGKTKGDQKLSGWTIFLDENDNYALDQNERSDITDDKGYYSFENLPLSVTYTICEVMQPGWSQTHPGTRSGCKSTTLKPSKPDVSGKAYSFGNQEIPTVDYCDPTQRPSGMSISQWLSDNHFDGSTCFEHESTPACGQFDAQFTRNDTGYNYKFRYVIDDNMPENWQGDGQLPVTFDEDQNDGSVTITYYAVGPEKDYFAGFGIPNFWDKNGETVTIDTDCLKNEQPAYNLEIIKRFCSNSPVVESLQITPLNFADFNCQTESEQTNDAQFTIYSIDSLTATPALVTSAAITADSFVNGISSTIIEDLAEKIYQVCEVEKEGYDTWVRMKNSDLSWTDYTNKNCIEFLPEITHTVEFVNVNIPSPSPSPSPTTQPSLTPATTTTPTPTPQVLGKQAEREDEAFVEATELPQTGAGNRAQLSSLIGLTVLALIRYRSQIG